MPGGLPGGAWAVLELTGTLLRIVRNVFIRKPHFAEVVLEIDNKMLSYIFLVDSGLD